MQIHSGQSERGRNECSGLFAVRTKGLAVLVQFRVEAAGPPAREDLFDSVDVNTEEIGERLEVWGKRHDRADVQIPIGPAVEAAADAWRKRIVDGRVAECALDAH